MSSTPGDAADLLFAHASHPGLLRKTNEDCCGASTSQNAFIVCDGMGGAAAGEVASHCAVEAFLQHLDAARIPEDAAERLGEAIQAANQAVLWRARETPGRRGMGTTLVAALFDPAPRTFWIAHVGDSRCYLLRDARLRLLTADHSLVEEQVRAGLLTREEAGASPVRHIITRALGSQPLVEPEIEPLAVCPGDLLLLASDGLNRELTDAEIEQILATPQPSLAATCQALLDAANVHGGRDNITVLLLRVP